MRILNFSRAAGAILLWFALAAAGAQEIPRGLDFLNDQLPIPDSARFDEAAYTQSGVGLAFGVDQRLSYFAGNYAEAVQRFQASTKKYKYRAEIWAFLARAQFYGDKPEAARETLKSAARLMPDLAAKLWNPLLDGLNWEIRQRANQLQLQLNFYAPDQPTFFSLFRYYRFLEAFEGASGVIHSAESRSRKMNELAEMSSANSFSSYRREADKWQGLADQLRAEMKSIGREVIPPKEERAPAEKIPSAGVDRDLLEETRRLQLLVDYYAGKPEDYQKLLDNYLLLAWPKHAASVIDALDREIERAKVRVDVAFDLQEQLDLGKKMEEFEALRKTLKQTLKAQEDLPSTAEGGQ